MELDRLGLNWNSRGTAVAVAGDMVFAGAPEYELNDFAVRVCGEGDESLASLPPR